MSDLPDNPRDRQKLLAVDVVSQYHGQDAALEAQKAALTLVQGNAAQAEAVPEFSLAAIAFPAKLFFILGASGLCKSSGEGRRQIQGGAVRVDGDRVEDVDTTYATAQELDGKVLQVGKKKFVRLVT